MSVPYITRRASLLAIGGGASALLIGDHQKPFKSAKLVSGAPLAPMPRRDPAPSVGQVTSTGDTSLDYAQFPAGVAALGQYARLDGHTIRKSLAWSSIWPEALGDRILIGLRGAELVDTDQEDEAGFVPGFNIRTVRPDHLTMRCVMGVWNQSNDTFFVAPGSTVPHRSYLEKQRIEALRAIAIGESPARIANLLPTGVYRYAVGTHQNGTASRQPGAFRMDDRVGVVRNLDGVREIPTRFDAWEFGRHDVGDNIHAAETLRRDLFWSAGCPVVAGDYTPDRASPIGAWRSFRIAAGLRPDPLITTPLRSTRKCVETDEDAVRVCRSAPLAVSRRRYAFILITGLEAALAALHPEMDANDTTFARLRRGSTGPRVMQLRASMGIFPAWNFDLETQHCLVTRFQAPAGLGADGMLTPQEAGRLDLDFHW